MEAFEDSLKRISSRPPSALRARRTRRVLIPLADKATEGGDYFIRKS